MNLPKKTLSSQRGQILILFLLVLVLGLAIVLSVASRTITDLRTSTTSDESNRAYFAAEAGLEEALQEIQSTGSLASDLSLNFTDTNTTATTRRVSGAGTRQIFVYPLPVERDDVAQVMMLIGDGDDDIDDADLDDGWLGGEITIWWGTNPAGVNSTNQAIEVSVLYHDGSFKITKFGFDPVNRGNNFCFSATGVSSFPAGEDIEDDVTEIGNTFYYSAVVNIRSGIINGCGAGQHGPGIGLAGASDPVFLRIRPLYNTDPIPVAVESADSAFPLPNQAFEVESTGQTVSGVTRKIKASSLFPALPSIFDYVLFNAGSSSLTKP